MLKSKAKCENLTKNNILCRASLRGLKKCTSCGYINGQRALICRNVNCDLRIRRLAAIKPFDPIELVTYGRTKLYSLRSKEKLLQPRNFVSVTETFTAMEGHPTTAVCYVDNCKYDALDPAHLVCRHIKACKVLTSVAQAEIYPIDKSVLWNLNISNEQKQHLWQLYQMEEHIIHPIQKLNSSIFVVKCEESKMFPAGRLHVTVFSDIVANKGGDFSCSCKKLKIILEPDNSVTMKQEICDHLLLLLAAILNKPEGKSLYGRFLDSLQYLWMPTSLNTPIVECESRSTTFMDYDDKTTTATTNIKIEHNLDSHNTDDIFNFTEELFAENNIPDFSDIILDVKTEKISIEEQMKKPLDFVNGEINLKDPKLNAISTSIKDEDLDLNFTHITPSTIATNLVAKVEEDFNGNGLSVIEQFQLNHNMQVSSDNIELAKDIENLNNLECQVFETTHSIHDQQKSLLKTSVVTNNSNNNNHHNNKEALKQTASACEPVEISNVPTLNTVPGQRSIVLKQGPVKIIKIATPVKCSSIQKLMPDNNNNNNNHNHNRIIQLTKINPNKIIVLKSNPIISQTKPIVNNVISSLEDNQQQTNNNNNNTVQPTLSYESWLDHVIEILNDSITVQEGNSIRNTFHVPEAIFNHFSKTFTLNNKRRLPNTTTVIKSGKYKDHIKYIWYFNQFTTVQRIFSSKNFKIELERSFQRLNDNNFVLYKPEVITLTENNNYRPIYPKLQLYKVLVQFSNNQDLYLNNPVSASKCGLKLEWLPSAFPKSNFGLMSIEFCVSVKEPDSL